MRRTSCANLERTDHLFGLDVAEQHGAFNDLSDVAALLRADGQRHGGWTVPLRSVSDPRPPRGTYSSLRNTTLLDTLAVEPDARKTAALWADTRFIVIAIDTETTKPPKGTGNSPRVVSIAAVTCRKGHMREQC